MRGVLRSVDCSREWEIVESCLNLKKSFFLSFEIFTHLEQNEKWRSVKYILSLLLSYFTLQLSSLINTILFSKSKRNNQYELYIYILSSKVSVGSYIFLWFYILWLLIIMLVINNSLPWNMEFASVQLCVNLHNHLKGSLCQNCTSLINTLLSCP